MLKIPKIARIVPGARFRHYKGNIYQIKCTAKHTETGESLVIYTPVDKADEIWARPIKMFCGKIVLPRSENGKGYCCSTSVISERFKFLE
jgi:hypothetical protein